MKRLKLIILSLIIAILLGAASSYLLYKNDRKINFSLANVNLYSSASSGFINSSQSANSYGLVSEPPHIPDHKKEQEAIDLAKNATNAYNDTDNDKFQDTEKYFKRLPRPKLENMDDKLAYIISDEFKDYSDDHMVFWVTWLMWRNKNMHFDNITDTLVTYSTENKYIVKVVLDDVLLTLDENTDAYTHKVDMILEYEVTKDDFDGQLKISHLTVQYLNDLDSYRDKIYENEKDDNRNNRNSATLNIFAPENAKGYDYTKVKNIDQEKAKKVFDLNVSKTVILGANNEYGLVTNGYGFFIRKGVVATSWKVAQMLFDDKTLNSSVITSDNKTHEIEGVVTASPDLDIAILKLKDEIGDKVSLGDAKLLDKQDPILVIGSPLGLVPILRAGLFADYLEEGSQKIKISLPLAKEDAGSPIFNLDGGVIGINTGAGNESPEFNGDASYAVSSEILRSAYEKLSLEKFSDISVIKKEDIEGLNSPDNDNKTFLRTNTKLYKQFSVFPNPEEIKTLKLESVFNVAGFLSLRYKNKSKDFIDNQLLIDAYVKMLKDNGFSKVFSSEKSETYMKDKNIIRIFSRFDYISIIYRNNI